MNIKAIGVTILLAVALALALGASKLRDGCLLCSSPQTQADGSAPKQEESTIPVVTLCSTYAGHPSDLGRVVEGVADDNIIPGLAIPACQQEVNRDPTNARLNFQLGRALKAGRREEEAAKYFRQAHEAGFCGTGYYLARLKMREYWGSAENRERNWAAVEEAKALLAKDGDCFDPSQELLGQLQHDPAEFAAPNVIQALWEGRIDDLNQNRITVAVYLEGFQHGVNDRQSEFRSRVPVCARAEYRGQAGRRRPRRCQ